MSVYTKYECNQPGVLAYLRNRQVPITNYELSKLFKVHPSYMKEIIESLCRQGYAEWGLTGHKKRYQATEYAPVRIAMTPMKTLNRTNDPAFRLMLERTREAYGTVESLISCHSNVREE